MMHGEDAVAARLVRRRWPVSEKLEVVRLTMEPGASVAEIARSHGMNANQLFKWRRLFEKGQLGDGGSRTTALLPVTITAGVETGEQSLSSGAIHIELPGRANISVESGADPALLRCVLESLRR